jgi:hypothetical protein
VGWKWDVAASRQSSTARSASFGRAESASQIIAADECGGPPMRRYAGKPLARNVLQTFSDAGDPDYKIIFKYLLFG